MKDEDAGEVVDGFFDVGREFGGRGGAGDDCGGFVADSLFGAVVSGFGRWGFAVTVR